MIVSQLKSVVKKFLVLCLFLGFASLGAPLGTSFGVAKPNLSTAKYGVVDMQRVILNVEEGKNARAELEKEIKAKEKELMKRKEELDKLNQDWQKQAALLSEQARMKKQQEFQQKFLSLRNDEMSFQNEIKRKEQEATQKIAIAVSKMVNDIAKDRGFKMVFETNSAGLLYLENPVDLTSDIIAAYEKAAKPSGSNAKK